ncbi:hypothetical protein ACFLQW_01350 [Candidatus Zixiibacteriota bacterium]
MMTSDTLLKDFIELFKPLLADANLTLEEIYQKGKALIKGFDGIELGASSQLQIVRKSDPQYDLITMFVRQRIQLTRAFISLKHYLKTHPTIQPHLLENSGGGSFPHALRETEIIQDLLLKYIFKKGDFKVNIRIISYLYRNLLKHFNRDDVDFIFTAYLENIGIGTNRTRLSDNVTMCNLTLSDVVNLYNSDSIFRAFYSGSNFQMLPHVKAAIYIKYKIPKNVTIPTKQLYPTDIRDGLERSYGVISALRAMVPDPVHCSPMISELRLLPFYNHRSSHGQNHFWGYQQHATINKCGLRKLRIVFAKLKQKTVEFPLLIPILDRLDIMNYRRTLEDRVVDIFICFEYLLRACTDEEYNLQTSSNDIALFLANLIGVNKSLRKDIFLLIKEGYRIRNRVVHAKKPRKAEWAMLNKLDEILRFALQRMIIDDGVRKRPLVEWLIR